MVEDSPDKASMFRWYFLLPKIMPSRVVIAIGASCLRLIFPLYSSMIA
jgi:hypothetical protein